MINKPTQFDMLYKCEIEAFKQLVHKPLDPSEYWSNYNDPTSFNRTPNQEVVEFVNIKMSRAEYERFNQNWDQYLTLMYVAKQNSMIYEEYHKLLMLTNLLA